MEVLAAAGDKEYERRCVARRARFLAHAQRTGIELIFLPDQSKGRIPDERGSDNVVMDVQRLPRRSLGEGGLSV